jgi:hypothetical protein
MVERVAVLLGTVQFRLKVKVDVPESATLADARGNGRWWTSWGLVTLSCSQSMISSR